MIRVLLINPPQTYYEQSQGFSTFFPLGLLYVAGMLKDICQVEIYDCLVSDFEIKKENGSVTYGASSKKIKKVIEEKQPDIIGISIPFTAQFKSAKNVACICKEVNPEITVVFGGPDPSVRYEYILDNECSDYCVVGEGEQTFYEFVKNFSSRSSLEHIKGLAFKRNGEIHYEPRPFISNLDELPFPAYDLINVNRYLQNRFLYKNRSHIHKNSISVITSRGCPYNCVFCSIKLHMGRKYRYHSPEFIMKHLLMLVEKYGISNFHFEDDNISLKKNRFEEILDRIISDKLNIQWDTPNGIRVDTLDYNILKKIKKSGCKQLTLAIESGSQRVLDEVIKKKTRLDYMIEIAQYCKELNIRSNSFYVIGFPGETLEEIKDTLNLALRLLRTYDILPTMLVATPLYGTELYEICIRENYIEGNPSVEELATATQIFGNPLISTPDFSKDAVKQLIHEYIFHLKKELILFSLKNPLYTARRLKDKLPLLKHLLMPG